MPQPVTRSYQFGPFRLEPASRRLLRAGAVLTLPAKAFDLLLALVERHGEIVDKDALLDLLWPDVTVEEANLSVNMSSLRKVLGERPHEQRYIATISGRGYKFVAPVTIVAEEESHPRPAPEPPVAGKPEIDVESAALEPEARQRSWLRWGSITVVLVVALAVWFGYRLVSSDRRVSARRVVPLTSYGGLKLQPAFSPDVRQVAFVWTGDRGDNPDIYVKQIDADGMLRLTNTPAAESSPVWSPDGRFIAFLRSQDDGAGVYLLPGLGGSERKLGDVRPTDTWSNLAWSPDGDHLAVSDRDPTGPAHAIFLVSVATGQRRQLTKPDSPTLHDSSPAFSPDGEHVAFVRGASWLAGDIFVTPAAGGAETRVTSDSRWIIGLSWMADSRTIVFSSNRGGLRGLWSVSATGGEPKALPVAGEDATFPVISRTGSDLAYVRWKNDSNIWRLDLPVADASAAQPVKLLASTREDALPQISPDGTRIAFLSSRSGDDEIWVARSDGRDPVQVSALKGAPGGSPRWSPDGKQLVFDGRPEGHSDIFVIGAHGGTARRLTTERSEDTVPSWSRDGRSVYFSSNRSGRMQIWGVPAAGGPAVQVTTDGGFEPFESTDGRSVFYFKRGGIWSVPVAGGAETLIVSGVRWGRWAVAPRGIYFLNLEVAPRPVIELFEFATQRVTRLAFVDPEPSIPSPPGFAVAPDERWLLFKRIDQSDNDIILVRNFQ